MAYKHILNKWMSAPYAEEKVYMLPNTEESVRVVTMVSPDTLKFSPFNPKVRTTSRAVAKLKEKIIKAGKIISPIIITTDSYVADGHRRLTVAKELGYTLVPVIQEDYNLADLWSMLNGGNMAVNRKNWMQAVRDGMPLECVPDSDKRVLQDLIRVMGKREFEKIVDSGRGPSIIIVAQYVARYCGDESDGFVRKIIRWFISCETLRDAKFFVSQHCPVEVLMDGINNNKKITQYWGVVS